MLWLVVLSHLIDMNKLIMLRTDREKDYHLGMSVRDINIDIKFAITRVEKIIYEYSKNISQPY